MARNKLLFPLNQSCSILSDDNVFSTPVSSSENINTNSTSTTTVTSSQFELENNIRLAAAHIDDAKFGRGICGKAYTFYSSRTSRICFAIVSNKWFTRLFYLAVIAHCFSAFLEPPSFSAGTIQVFVAVAISILCLLVYLLDILLKLKSFGFKGFFVEAEFTITRLELILFCVFLLDYVSFAILKGFQIKGTLIIQPFRALRAFMILTKSRNVTHVVRAIFSVTLKFSTVLLVAFVFILLYACAGVHLLMPYYQNLNDSQILALATVQKVLNISSNDTDGVSINNPNLLYEGVFDNIGKALIQLFVLLTSENYPAFMFPAFAVTKAYFIYFSSFIFAGAFLLTAIQLAIIADTYWDFHKKRARRQRSHERAELVKAWKLLSLDHKESLSVENPQLLSLFQILKPNNTKEDNIELIRELDPTDTGKVDWLVWVTDLLRVLNLERTQPTINNKTLSPLRLKLQKILGKIVKWHHFKTIVLMVIILHSILFALRWNDMPFSAQLAIQVTKTVILVLFVIEMILRIGAVRVSLFFKSTLEVLDFALVIIAVIANLTWYGTFAVNDQFILTLWRGLSVVIACVAIFLRIFFNSQMSNKVLVLFLKLIPIIIDLISLFIIVVYFYAVIGMEFFGRFDVRPGNQYEIQYLYDCGLGFRDMSCATFMVFQIAMANNWNEIMNVIVSNLDNYLPVIYFITCYVILNMLVTNVLAAIVIEAYNKFFLDSEKDNTDSDEKTVKEKLSCLWKWFKNEVHLINPTNDDTMDTLRSFSVSQMSDKSRPTSHSNLLSRHFNDNLEVEKSTFDLMKSGYCLDDSSEKVVPKLPDKIEFKFKLPPQEKVDKKLLRQPTSLAFQCTLRPPQETERVDFQANTSGKQSPSNSIDKKKKKTSNGVKMKNAKRSSVLSITPSASSIENRKQKFRQAIHSNNNWSVDVMEETIISPNEVTELRKELDQILSDDPLYKKHKSSIDFRAKIPPRTRQFRKKSVASMIGEIHRDVSKTSLLSNASTVSARSIQLQNKGKDSPILMRTCAIEEEEQMFPRRSSSTPVQTMADENVSLPGLNV